jgi:hypothetical protein
MAAVKSRGWEHRKIAGLVLLAVAAVALLDRYVALRLGVAAPLLIGLGFVIWSLVARNPALLIPGGILTGLGGGLVVERMLSAGPAIDRAVILLGLAFGFALISILTRMAFRQRVRWPLIPALVLMIVGGVHLAGAELRQVTRLLYQFWTYIALAVAANGADIVGNGA